jgi:hypothetical protein
LGVGMLEAVHRSQPIMCLLPAAECEVEMAGQVLIVNPPLTGPPVWFAEHPPLALPSDGDAALMDCCVMPLTEQDQITNTALRVPSGA